MMGSAAGLVGVALVAAAAAGASAMADCSNYEAQKEAAVAAAEACVEAGQGSVSQLDGSLDAAMCTCAAALRAGEEIEGCAGQNGEEAFIVDTFRAVRGNVRMFSVLAKAAKRELRCQATVQTRGCVGYEPRRAAALAEAEKCLKKFSRDWLEISVDQAACTCAASRAVVEPLEECARREGDWLFTDRTLRHVRSKFRSYQERVEAVAPGQLSCDAPIAPSTCANYAELKAEAVSRVYGCLAVQTSGFANHGAGVRARDACRCREAAEALDAFEPCARSDVELAVVADHRERVGERQASADDLIRRTGVEVKCDGVVVP